MNRWGHKRTGCESVVGGWVGGEFGGEIDGEVGMSAAAAHMPSEDTGEGEDDINAGAGWLVFCRPVVVFPVCSNKSCPLFVGPWSYLFWFELGLGLAFTLYARPKESFMDVSGAIFDLLFNCIICAGAGCVVAGWVDDCICADYDGFDVD